VNYTNSPIRGKGEEGSSPTILKKIGGCGQVAWCPLWKNWGGGEKGVKQI